MRIERDQRWEFERRGPSTGHGQPQDNAEPQRAKATDFSIRWQQVLRGLGLGVRTTVDQFFERAWASYALIALLQLKIVWQIWRFRDLPIGDTSNYFIIAYRWYEAFADFIIWSPLYTIFYGTLFMLAGDAYVATILHRVIIVMAASLGILALMRALLPPSLALLVGMWWVILPINFDTLY